MNDATVHYFWDGSLSRRLLPFMVCILSVMLTCALWNEWPVARISSRQARTEAQVMLRTLYAAMGAYQRDYGRFPSANSTVAGQDTVSDSGAEEDLAASLLGLDSTLNPRKIDYIGDIKDARDPDGRYPKNGLIRKNDTAAIVDPWGHPYHIHIDTDGDGLIANPQKGSAPLKQKILIWSDGKDGDPDTWEDNIRSWWPDWIAPRTF